MELRNWASVSKKRGLLKPKPTNRRSARSIRAALEARRRRAGLQHFKKGKGAVQLALLRERRKNIKNAVTAGINLLYSRFLHRQRPVMRGEVYHDLMQLFLGE